MEYLQNAAPVQQIFNNSLQMLQYFLLLLSLGFSPLPTMIGVGLLPSTSKKSYHVPQSFISDQIMNWQGVGIYPKP
jgi:hypothetical protein